MDTRRGVDLTRGGSSIFGQATPGGAYNGHVPAIIAL